MWCSQALDRLQVNCRPPQDARVVAHGWGWPGQRDTDLAVTLDGHSVASEAVFGSTDEAASSYDWQFERACSRPLNSFAFGSGANTFLCRFKVLRVENGSLHECRCLRLPDG